MKLITLTLSKSFIGKTFKRKLLYVSKYLYRDGNIDCFDEIVKLKIIWRPTGEYLWHTNESRHPVCELNLTQPNLTKPYYILLKQVF